MALKDILYTPVEPLNHAVCLRRLWWGQTMVDAEFAAQRIELMFASRCTLAQAKETVSKLLTVANVARTIGAIIGSSVRMVRMRSGHARSRSRRKRRALAAVLLL
jgi:integral membrane sensor domain MASE1